jgi:hypothetical protein
MTDNLAKPLPRHVTGHRPAIHADPAIDRLIAMVLSLTREVSVLRDRFDTLEIIGQESGWLKPGAVDAYMPPLEVRQRRETSREAMIGRVLAILSEEIADLEAGETDDAFWTTVTGIEKGEI